MEKRAEHRHKGLYRSTIIGNGIIYNGYTLDISNNGMRIVYTGKTVVPGTVVQLKVNELKTAGSAEVIWTKKVSEDMFHAGLRVI